MRCRQCHFPRGEGETKREKLYLLTAGKMGNALYHQRTILKVEKPVEVKLKLSRDPVPLR
jgi:hypothetical protein